MLPLSSFVSVPCSPQLYFAASHYLDLNSFWLALRLLGGVPGQDFGVWKRSTLCLVLAQSAKPKLLQEIKLSFEALLSALFLGLELFLLVPPLHCINGKHLLQLVP
mmetsp:Transcript_8789/g.14711  ORF Transcript_8789/g.14711 Transcript_8789/m.14711 type:complete len:106 (+) Transcript_8789:201-518(+)